MINSNEVRLGNWVNENIGVDFNTELVPVKVFSICPAQVGVSSVIPQINEHGEGRFTGIPITPYFLEKFGLKRQAQQNKYGESSFAIFKKGSDYLWARTTDDFGDIENGWPGPVEVKYLHQLQNLYFALTGNELIIKDLKEGA